MPRIKISLRTPVMSMTRTMSLILPNNDFVLNLANPGGIPLSGREQASRGSTILADLISNNPRNEHLHYMLKCVDEAISNHTSSERAECVRRMNQQASLPMEFHFAVTNMDDINE